MDKALHDDNKLSDSPLKDEVSGNIEAISDDVEANVNNDELSSQVEVVVDEALNEKSKLQEELEQEELKAIQTVDDDKESNGAESNAYEDELNDFNPDDEIASVSDDIDQSTIINNEHYDRANDSAYETNEMVSQNGSSSRLQSADTNGIDIDNETGENFLTPSPGQTQIEIIDDIGQLESDDLRIDRFIEDPTPTIVDDDDDHDVVVGAGKATLTGHSPTVTNDSHGAASANDEVL